MIKKGSVIVVNITNNANGEEMISLCEQHND
jgi:hypothetical protein